MVNAFFSVVGVALSGIAILMVGVGVWLFSADVRGENRSTAPVFAMASLGIGAALLGLIALALLATANSSTFGR